MDPSFQQFMYGAFQIFITAAVGATGWFVRGLSTRQDLQQQALLDLERKLHETEVELPRHYVRKADLEALMKDIRDHQSEAWRDVREHLIRIEQKIEGKADK